MINEKDLAILKMKTDTQEQLAQKQETLAQTENHIAEQVTLKQMAMATPNYQEAPTSTENLKVAASDIKLEIIKLTTQLSELEYALKKNVLDKRLEAKKLNKNRYDKKLEELNIEHTNIYFENKIQKYNQKIDSLTNLSIQNDYDHVTKQITDSNYVSNKDKYVSAIDLLNKKVETISVLLQSKQLEKTCKHLEVNNLNIPTKLARQTQLEQLTASKSL